MTEKAPVHRNTTVRIGLLADPGLPADLADWLAEHLPHALRETVSNEVGWDVISRCEPIPLNGDGQVPVTDLAREHRGTPGWDLLLVLTELPRRAGTRLLASEFLPAVRAGLVSVPALGASACGAGPGQSPCGSSVDWPGPCWRKREPRRLTTLLLRAGRCWTRPCPCHRTPPASMGSTLAHSAPLRGSASALREPCCHRRRALLECGRASTQQRGGATMFWDAVPRAADEPEFTVEWTRLRPGVPIVRARGRLDRTTVGDLRRAMDRCLETAPWAVVVDLRRVTELRAGAIPKLGDMVERARADYVGLHFVTNGGAVDGLLGCPPSRLLLVIHHSIAAAQQALGR